MNLCAIFTKLFIKNAKCLDRIGETLAGVLKLKNSFWILTIQVDTLAISPCLVKVALFR